MSQQNIIQYVTNYKKIIEVRVLHNFFLNGEFSQMRIKPNVPTRSMLNDYGIIFRNNINGFVLIIDNDEKFSSPTFKGDLTLHFDMDIKDDNFLNYTDILYTNDQKLHFTNIYDNKLHKKEFVDNDVSHVNNNGVFSAEVILVINKKNEYFGYGKKKPNIKESNYTINFNARKIQLRYNFITSVKNVKSFYLTDEENELYDQNFYKRVLSSGKEVYSIEHNTLTAAGEFYDIKRFLKKSQTEEALVSLFSLELPHPRKENISFDASSNIFYADVYITLD